MFAALVRGLALSLLLPVALLAMLRSTRGPAAPNVTVVSGTPTRVAVRCEEAHVELGGSVPAYGTKGTSERAFAELKRSDASVTCVNARGRAEARLAPIGLRSVTPGVVKDSSGVRVVLTLDGQALGPFSAPDDGVYLVRSRGLVRLDAACPELRVEHGRVVVCAADAQLRGRGPARVRVQSAGRLEEASTVIDFEKLL